MQSKELQEEAKKIKKAMSQQERNELAAFIRQVRRGILPPIFEQRRKEAEENLRRAGLIE